MPYIIDAKERRQFQAMVNTEIEACIGKIQGKVIHRIHKYPAFRYYITATVVRELLADIGAKTLKDMVR